MAASSHGGLTNAELLYTTILYCARVVMKVIPHSENRAQLQVSGKHLTRMKLLSNSVEVHRNLLSTVVRIVKGRTSYGLDKQLEMHNNG